MTNEVCPRIGAWRNACMFKPRYEKGASELSVEAVLKLVDEGFDAVDILDMTDKYRPDKYVCDVCVTCGKAVNDKR